MRILLDRSKLLLVSLSCKWLNLLLAHSRLFQIRSLVLILWSWEIWLLQSRFHLSTRIVLNLIKIRSNYLRRDRLRSLLSLFDRLFRPLDNILRSSTSVHRRLLVAIWVWRCTSLVSLLIVVAYSVHLIFIIFTKAIIKLNFMHGDDYLLIQLSSKLDPLNF
jgi:hypothetical protein